MPKPTFQGIAAIAAVVGLAATSALAQSQDSSTGLVDDTAPINCATAEGDIRALNAEKEYAKNHALENASALVPAGMLLGILTGTESKKLQMLSPEYTKHIDIRIAEIEKKCRVN